MGNFRGVLQSSLEFICMELLSLRCAYSLYAANVALRSYCEPLLIDVDVAISSLSLGTRSAYVVDNNIF
jgi:hypothetical protein